MDYSTAVQTLKERLDSGHRMLAVQDFRHTRQKETEAVADFIGRLERTFQLAYGKDPMSSETRHMLLYGQLQEGVRDEILRSSAVSGALTYPALCLAAKNEEQRQAELKRRQQYWRSDQIKGGAHLPSNTSSPTLAVGSQVGQWKMPKDTGARRPRECYECGSTDHLYKDCHQGGSESTGRPPPKRLSGPETRMVKEKEVHPEHLLYSDSDTDDG